MRSWNDIGSAAGRARVRRVTAMLALGALGLVAWEGSAWAQASPPVPERRREQTLAETTRQAELLLRHGQTLPAIELLEALHADHPADARVTMLLGRAYQTNNEPARAVALLETVVASVARNDLAMWIELSRAHERAGQGEEAVRTLLAGSRDHPGWGRELVDRFELLLADSAQGPGALRTLEAAAHEKDAPVVWLEILGNAYASRGETMKALDLLMRVERRQKGDGRIALTLATTLARSDQPELALAAYDSVLSLAPREGTVEECWFEKGRLLEGLGRHAEAMAAYRQVEERFPHGTLAPRATLTRAGILLRSGNASGARGLLEQLLERVTGEPRRSDLRTMRDDARVTLAECALREGDFTGAREIFGDLGRSAARAEVREQAAFEQAELLFYEGKLVEAEQAYYALTDSFRTGDWVNNALERVLLLGEHATAGDALKPYGQILYQRRIGNRERALALCREALAAYRELPLRAELRLEEVRLLTDEANWPAADSSLALLLVEQPRARAVPQALLLLAETGLAREARHDAARAYLEQLVLQYPDSSEARRARAILAELRKSDAHS